MNRVMTRGSALLCLVLMALPATGQELSDATLGAGFDAARDRADRCTKARAVDLDDGVTDARTVAKTAVSLCRAELDAWFLYGEPGVDDVVEFRQVATESVVDNLAGFLLTMRSIMGEAKAAVP